jgi:hypothetical protein
MNNTSEHLPAPMQANEQLRFRNLTSATRVAEFILQKRVMDEGGYRLLAISRAEAYKILPDIDWLRCLHRHQAAVEYDVPAIVPQAAFGLTSDEFEQFHRAIEDIALEEMYRA